MSEASANPSGLPRQFGDYELLDEIGRGGFGTIYKARQGGLNRLCAVKMLHTQDAAADTALMAEAQAAASLDHPNIVGIYEVGREQGRLFFSMEFVEGQNLAAFTRQQIVSAQRVATYARKIADAVAYAHARGVLHCDLKPANVLIDPHDEPQITDFGLARRVGVAGHGPETTAAGSPNFMAPEQCDAHFGSIGPRTDVFGLGAILYFLLTDRPPFRGETLADTVQAVRTLDPVRPRELRAGVPRDLETICLRCLEKRPGRRYHDAREVADELGRFLNDEPIHARRITPVERLWRRARRHPWLTGFATTTVALLTLVAVGSSVAAFRINHARQQADHERRALDLLQKRTAQNLYAADLALAFEAWSAGNDTRVREILDRHRPTNGAPDLRSWEWRFLAAQSRADHIDELPAHPGEIYQLVLLPDGRTLIAGDAANTLRLWSYDDRRLLREAVVRSGGSPRFAVAPDGRQLALVDRRERETNTLVRLLDLPGLTTNATFSVAGVVQPARFTPEGTALWLASRDQVQLLGLRTGDITRRLPLERPSPFLALRFSADTARLAVGEESGHVALYDVASGRLLARNEGHEDRPPWNRAPYVVEFSPDGQLLASGGGDGTVRLWDGVTLAPLGVLRGHTDLVMALGFAAHNRYLVSAGRDPSLFVWDVAARQLVAQPRGHRSLIRQILFLGESEEFLSAGEDRVIRRWRPTATPRWRVETNFPAGTTVAFLLPGERHYLATQVNAAEATVLRLADNRVVARLAGDTNALGFGVWMGDGDSGLTAQYAPGGRTRVQPLNDPAGGFELVDTNWVPFQQRGFGSVAFSRDGKRLAVTDPANGVHVWDLASRKLEWASAGGSYRAAEFSPGGWVAAAEINGTIHLLDPRTGQRQVVAEPAPMIQGFAFSADDRLFAAISFDGTVRVFETASRRRLHTLTARVGSLISGAFSPDGTRMFAGNVDGVVSLWDLATGRELAAAKVHAAPVYSVGFAPDGGFVSVGPDGVRFWLMDQQ